MAFCRYAASTLGRLPVDGKWGWAFSLAFTHLISLTASISPRRQT